MALPLGGLKVDSAGEQLDYVSYPRDGAPARLAIANDVFTIGFPIGFDPLAGHPFPVWTRGSIAWPPRIDWNGKPSFLIDSRTRPGQSGSPVVFYADETMNYVDRDGTLRRGPAWGLVGVYTGRLHRDSDIGVVWKRSVIEDILDNGQRPQRRSSTSLLFRSAWPPTLTVVLRPPRRATTPANDRHRRLRASFGVLPRAPSLTRPPPQDVSQPGLSSAVARLAA